MRIVRFQDLQNLFFDEDLSAVASSQSADDAASDSASGGNEEDGENNMVSSVSVEEAAEVTAEMSRLTQRDDVERETDSD
jgi:hypothetical protein